jgi:hypothetical protein
MDNKETACFSGGKAGFFYGAATRWAVHAFCICGFALTGRKNINHH